VAKKKRPRVYRNMSTPESRAFWVSVDRVAKDVSTWPDWKRAGINVSDRRRRNGE
jgi:hypothetical protein